MTDFNLDKQCKFLSKWQSGRLQNPIDWIYLRLFWYRRWKYRRRIDFLPYIGPPSKRAFLWSHSLLRVLWFKRDAIPKICEFSKKKESHSTFIEIWNSFLIAEDGYMSSLFREESFICTSRAFLNFKGCEMNCCLKKCQLTLSFLFKLIEKPEGRQHFNARPMKDDHCPWK